jgi:PAS domain S-box-containing protein
VPISKVLGRSLFFIWVMLFVSLVGDAGGRPLFPSQIEDITERKRAERAASAGS